MECERLEKRLEGMGGSKPKVDSEQIQLEAELQYIYKIYVEKIRNHDYLEQKLEECINIERIKDKFEKMKLDKMRDDHDKIYQRLYFDKPMQLEDDDGEGNDPYKYRDTEKINNNRINQTGHNNRTQQKQNYVNDDDDDGFGDDDEEDDFEGDEESEKI